MPKAYSISAENIAAEREREEADKAQNRAGYALRKAEQEQKFRGI